MGLLRSWNGSDSERGANKALGSNRAFRLESKGRAMNLQKLRENVEWLKKQLGAGLMACDIWSDVGLSLAGYNEQPEAVALFNEVTRYLRRAVDESGGAFPNLGRYYMVELEGKRLVLILLAGELQWGILIDGTQSSLGVIVSVILQGAIKRLQEASEAGEE